MAGSRLDRAKSLLAQNGSLTEAALLLEAAIQQGELGEGGYEAWILLGETRSMDEREESAIRALQEGVRRATEAGAGGAGMLVSALLMSSLTSLIYIRSHSLLRTRMNLMRKARTQCSCAGFSLVSHSTPLHQRRWNRCGKHPGIR